MSKRQELETQLMDVLSDLWKDSEGESFLNIVERNLFYATGQDGWTVSSPPSLEP